MRVSTVPRDRETVRAKIAAAFMLAVGGNSAEAYRVLADVGATVDPGDHEIAALYLQARGIADVSARRIADGFQTFEMALHAARAHGDPAIYGKILGNYGTSAIYNGEINLAIALLEEALEAFRSVGGSISLTLVNLAGALHAAGQLQRAAALLHAFHAIQGANTETVQTGRNLCVLSAARIGIHVGMLLPDDALLDVSYEPTLLELGFTSREPLILGPLVEAFCTVYEREGMRQEHDALLNRTIDGLTSLADNVDLALRIARLGDAHHLPRISALMAQQCSGGSSILNAYKLLFDAFIAARRQLPERATQLAAHAASEFGCAGHLLQQALALEASGKLALAEDLRRRCGADGPGRLLRWSGGPLRKRLATNLTPREREVAELIASGSTNRTVASLLGLSERTVHRHCESIFGKLGIHSSRQLPVALAGLGSFTHAELMPFR